MSIKRFIFGTIVFFSAFAVGYFFVLPFLSARTGTIERPAEQVPALVTISDPDERFADFVPEFTNIDLNSEADTVRLEYGEVGGCEVDPKLEREWLVLFKSGDEYTLEKRSIRFGPRSTDGFGGYFEMQFDDRENALFLIEDSDTLKPRRVKMTYFDNTPPTHDLYDGGEFSIATGFDTRFHFGEKEYRLRVADGTNTANNPVAALVLEADGKSQIIWYKYLMDREAYLGEVEWMGDLDGDGALDMNFGYNAQNGGGGRNILFISSLGGSDELVKAHAFHLTRRAMHCDDE